MNWNCVKQLSELNNINSSTYRSILVGGNPGKRPMSMNEERNSKRPKPNKDSENESDSEEDEKDKGEEDSEEYEKEESDEESEEESESEKSEESESEEESTDDEKEDREEMMEKIDNYMRNVLHVEPYGTPYDKEDVLAHLSFEEHKALDEENKRIDEILRKEEEEKAKAIEKIFSKSSSVASSTKTKPIPPGKRGVKPQPSKRKKE